MSGKVLLLFLLLGAVYLEAQAQPGAGGEYAYIHATHVQCLHGSIIIMFLLKKSLIILATSVQVTASLV